MLRQACKCAALIIALAAAPALASGGGGGGGGAVVHDDAELTEAQAAIDKQDWNDAIRILQAYVAMKPGSADGYNLLGYSSRKKGDLDSAFRYYDKALTIDPKHRGAHEYLGEAYLLAGNLAKAREHLDILDHLCFFPCKEFKDLKTAVTAYEAKAR